MGGWEIYFQVERTRQGAGPHLHPEWEHLHGSGSGLYPGQQQEVPGHLCPLPVPVAPARSAPARGWPWGAPAPCPQGSKTGRAGVLGPWTFLLTSSWAWRAQVCEEEEEEGEPGWLEGAALLDSPTAS